MDEKQKIDDLVSKLDSYMGNGGGHLSGDSIKKAESASEKQTSECNLFASDVNDCPACANIPNISDVDTDDPD